RAAAGEGSRTALPCPAPCTRPARHAAPRAASRLPARRAPPPRHCHGLGRGIAALARHDWRQHRQRHHFLQLPFEQAENRRRQKGRRKVDQQPVEAPARDKPHRIRQFLLAADATEGPNVLLSLLLDDVDDVVEGDAPDEPIRLVNHRGRDEVSISLTSRGRSSGSSASIRSPTSAWWSSPTSSRSVAEFSVAIACST